MDAKNLFSVNRKSSRINESLSKKFGTRLNLESFDLQQLEDSRNRLRTQISQIRQNSNFNENLENDSFIKAQFMLDAINAEIEERDEHIVEADIEEGKMKDLHQDVEEYLAYMSDVFNDREEYDLANELHNLSFELDKIGVGGVMKELKQLTYWGDPLAKGVYKEFSKKFGKFAEGFDGDLEEGEHEVDYDLHQLALYGDEDDLIDALGGDQGPHVAEALKDMMEELKDELASKGMNDVIRDEDKMIEMLADKLFDEYGEDGEEYGDMDSRYDRSDSDADADALKSAGFGSDEDYESIQFEKAPPGAKAERMVKHIKKGYADDGKLTKKEKSIAYATAWKHHNKNKDESTEEGIISTPAKLIGKTIGGVSKAAGAIAGVPGGIARAFRKGKRRSQDVISGDDGDRDKNESVTQGEEMTTLREGEVQQASAIVTAKTMVDRVGRWIEELSGMENETLLQLGDSIRDEMGQEQSRAFIEQVAPAIQSALETLKGTRETISNGVNTLATGEPPADMLGSEPAAGGDMEEPAAGGDMEMPAEEPAGDEFSAAEPAAGGAEAAGREQRESIQFQNRLMKMLAG